MNPPSTGGFERQQSGNRAIVVAIEGRVVVAKRGRVSQSMILRHSPRAEVAAHRAAGLCLPMMGVKTSSAAVGAAHRAAVAAHRAEVAAVPVIVGIPPPMTAALREMAHRPPMTDVKTLVVGE